MSNDDFLERATRAVREEHPNTSADPLATLRRIQVSVAKEKRQTRRTRTLLLPIAATLMTSTAFAAATGHLTPVLRAVEEIFHPQPAEPVNKATESPARKVSSTAKSAPTPAAPDPTDPTIEEALPAPEAVAPVAGETPAHHAGGNALVPSGNTDSSGESSLVPSGNTGLSGKTVASGHAVSSGRTGAAGNIGSSGKAASSSPSSARVPPAREAGGGSSSPKAPVAEETAPKAPSTDTAPANSAAYEAPRDPADDLYLRAHKMHFSSANPAATLASWDDYLKASPNGRFAPEARFNRAVTLIKLGRRAEAASALEPFADGTFGSYRKDEARSLLQAIGR